MFIEIITPDKKVFAGEASAASFPGTQGAFQILNNHAPLVSTIGKGEVVVDGKEGQKTFTVDGGVVEVLNNKVLVLAEAIR